MFLGTICLLSLSVCVAALSAESVKKLFQFTGGNPASAWIATNDGVMGGLSEGGARLVDDGMLFSGALSLEKNGGFSSIFERVDYNLSLYEGMRLKVLGDGRTYQLRLNSDAMLRPGEPVSFARDFATVNGEWIDVFVPFGGLRQIWRGRELSGYKFNPAKIKRVGLLLADKQAGEFSLEVQSIFAVAD